MRIGEGRSGVLFMSSFFSGSTLRFFTWEVVLRLLRLDAVDGPPLLIAVSSTAVHC